LFDEDSTQIQLFLLKLISRAQIILFCHDKFSANTGNRIFHIQSLSSKFKIDSVPLLYTPRDFIRHPNLPLLYVAESDNGLLPLKLVDQLCAGEKRPDGSSASLDPRQFGFPKAKGYWASCIQVIDMDKLEVVDTQFMEDGDCLTSIGLPFIKNQEERFVIASAAHELNVSPRSAPCGYIYVFGFEKQYPENWQEGMPDPPANYRKLDYIYKSEVVETDDRDENKKTPLGVPMAVTPFKGQFLVGVGRDLYKFDLGTKCVLRKARCYRATPNTITSIQVTGSRIICTDVKDSVTMLQYKYKDNYIVPFCDDVVSRWCTTASCMPDYHSAVAGDKFGNIFMLRPPPAVSAEVDRDVPGQHLVHDRPYLGGQAYRFDLVMHYFVNDIPTGFFKGPLIPVGKGGHVLFWAGLRGTLGCFIPMITRADIEFFVQLELKMRDQDKPLTGRDHLAFRGYYVPPKGCVDGDLCERYLVLSREKKVLIAQQLDRKVDEVEKRILDMRYSYAY
jgi:splicing factor 3B subunit 3